MIKATTAILTFSLLITFFALIARAATYAPNNQTHSQTHVNSHVPEAVVTFDLPADPPLIIRVPMMVIVGHAPAAKVSAVQPSALRWTCGEQKELLQGSGTAATCEWM